MSVLTFRAFSRLFAARFSHRCGARLCHRGRRANPTSGGRRHGAEGEGKAEAEAHSGACRAATGASARSSDRTCARCATGLAWGAAQCQSRNLRSGAQQPLHHHRHDFERHHSIHDQRTARWRQYPGRENPAASAWRHAGFRGQRPPARPQRSRQCAVSHQRRDAARRPHRFRQHSRRQLDRQHGLGGRRASGGIRAANGGVGRHHDPRRHFQ